MNTFRVFVLTFMIAVGFIFPAMAVANESCITRLYNRPYSYNQWYYVDRQHAEAFAEAADDAPEYRGKFIDEWQQITQELNAALASGYVDKEGFTIYSPETSGKIHVLGLAKYYREQLLEESLNKKTTGWTYPELLAGCYPAGIPSIENGGFFWLSGGSSFKVPEVAKSIKALGLPTDAFQGITVYLLPYHIAGYKAFAFSQELPGQEEAIYIGAAEQSSEIQAIVAHELGHCILFQKRTAIFGNQSSSKSNTSVNFNNMGDETLAESIRVVYGFNAARTAMPLSEEYSGLISSQNFQKFFREIVNNAILMKHSNYFDLNDMSITCGGAEGQPIRLKVGTRPEQINTIVTTSPDVSFISTMPSGWEKEFTPVGILSQYEKISVESHYLPITVRNREIQIDIVLPKEGTYYLFLGQAHPNNRIKNQMRFKIIFIRKQ
ncbi:MAG: hypothetical protein ACM3MK_04145 [Chitinophagales bacterium]